MAEPYSVFDESDAGMIRALEVGDGIVRLAPAWVPRLFCSPGRRIRLHPSDYFAYGIDRGGIDERWFASTVRADNGPLTTPHEGVSLVVGSDGLIPFDAFVAHLGADLLGSRLWDRFGGWPMYSKFFDNQQPLPFHMHQMEKHAKLVGKQGKPEAYYYAPEMNNHLGDQPIAYFGLRPGVTKAMVRDAIERFADGGDNRITDLALAYRLELGTGWDIPAGVLHAPPSVCTYEPQVASDVFSMWESWSNNREVPEALIWKDVPSDKHGDFDFLMELLDWDANVDADFAINRFRPKVETEHSASQAGAGWTESWITYKSGAFSAKELRVDPGREVTLKEDDPYGTIVIGGRGTIGSLDVAAATLIRFGALSEDEIFVSQDAASRGVTVRNTSSTEPLVLLKHYGPGNAELTAQGLAE